ncbi:L-xylulose reductase isoform X2 [Panthera leo]|uniref:L-xylulose reductase isoform X2 n=1 Tax=Panthera leo TaxID=9689 RepID=UPI001C6A5660|nr:L-xylulose reductase isoform X2 [Panthera leo]
MDLGLAGRRALVTGAGKGIGRGTVKALHAAGVQVVALSRTRADLDSLVVEPLPGRAASGGTATPPGLGRRQKWLLCRPGALGRRKWTGRRRGQPPGHQARRCPGTALGPLPPPSAACVLNPKKPFLEVTKEACDTSFDVNLRAVIQVSQIVARGLIARGAPGAIVNISSQASQRAITNHSVYCSTKGAMDMLTRVMALELGPHKIRVNAVNPTVVMTPMAQANWSDPQKAKAMLDRIPLGRFAEVENVVDVILFLLSDRSSMTTGSTVPVDGGFLAT